MRKLCLAAATVNQTPLDWSGNTARIRVAISAARAAHAQILCLPELCITGYGCEDAFHAPNTWARAADALEDLLPETRGLAVALGLPLYHRGAVYNTVALCVDGALAGFVAKQNLAGDGLHYEPRHFKAWPGSRPGRRGANAGVTTTDFRGRQVPIGDLLFDLGGVRLGMEICEDAWVAHRPGAAMTGEAADVILNPSASHFAFDKADVREQFVANGSRAFGVAYVYTNLVGNEAGRAIYDGHALIASSGKVIARGPRLSFADSNVTTALVDLEAVRADNARRVSYHPDTRPHPRTVAVDFAPAPHPNPHAPQPAVPPPAHETREQDFARAVALGLFDYARKSRSRGFVVSLSGGADSAAAVCCVAKALELAVDELGMPAVLQRLHLSNDDPAAACTDARQLTGHLLTTLYQATRNSGDATRDAAAELAEGLGTTHHVLDVDDVVASYTAKVEAALGRALTWDRDDIALQNIQARVRAPSAWMFANIENKLLLSTSNRSEAAVGYATMDGDTSGGLAPLAGIDKHFLRSWLKWLEDEGPRGGSPVPSLHAVNRLQPTAELRPDTEAGEAQTDEADLMPYDLLDDFEDALISRRLSPQAMFDEQRTRRPEIPPAQLGVYLRRFLQLFARNQWKRERYAPAFHLDDRNLDPKTWCRYPILSGGFRDELGALETDAT